MVFTRSQRSLGALEVILQGFVSFYKDMGIFDEGQNKVSWWVALLSKKEHEGISLEIHSSS